MILALILMIYIFKKNKLALTDALIYGSAVWGTIVFIITEILSLFNMITRMGLYVSWGMVVIGLVMVAITKYGILYDLKATAGKIKIQALISGIKNKCVYIILAGYSAGVLGIAFKNCPYNWDSMVYHLPRIFYWSEHRNVAHFATMNTRQIASPVLGDFINLHIYVMTGQSDRFFNLSQACAYILCGILIYQITMKILNNNKWGLVSAIMFYSMRIAFSEAFTSQVDILASFWVFSFVYLILDFLSLGKKLEFVSENILKVIILSLIVALGYISKPYSGIICLLFAVWLLFVCIYRKDSLKHVLSLIVVAVPGFLLVMLPELIRNYITFKAFSPDCVGKRQLIGTLNPPYVIVNAVKNFCFNLPTVWFFNSDEIVYQFCNRIAGLLNVNIMDPSISEDGAEYAHINIWEASCDTAINPIILWTLIIAVLLALLVIFYRIIKKEKGQLLLYSIPKVYTVVAILSFAIFCCVLRYEGAVSRYMIAFLGILTPAICYLFSRVFLSEYNQHAVRVIIVLWAITDIIYSGYYNMQFWSSSRNQGYWGFNPSGYWGYEEVLSDLDSIDGDKLGIYFMTGGVYEFPYLQVLKDKYSRIEPVNMEDQLIVREDMSLVDLVDEMVEYEDASFSPDVILAFYTNADSINCHGNNYVLNNRYENNASIYVKEY